MCFEGPSDADRVSDTFVHVQVASASSTFRSDLAIFCPKVQRSEFYFSTYRRDVFMVINMKTMVFRMWCLVVWRQILAFRRNLLYFFLILRVGVRPCKICCTYTEPVLPVVAYGWVTPKPLCYEGDSKNRRTWRENFLIATFSTTICVRTNLRANPALQGENPGTHPLGYGSVMEGNFVSVFWRWMPEHLRNDIYLPDYKMPHFRRSWT